MFAAKATRQQQSVFIQHMFALRLSTAPRVQICIAMQALLGYKFAVIIADLRRRPEGVCASRSGRLRLMSTCPTGVVDAFGGNLRR